MLIRDSGRATGRYNLNIGSLFFFVCLSFQRGWKKRLKGGRQGGRVDRRKLAQHFVCFSFFKNKNPRSSSHCGTFKTTFSSFLFDDVWGKYLVDLLSGWIRRYDDCFKIVF
jgi:hypothetical protein